MLLLSIYDFYLQGQNKYIQNLYKSIISTCDLGDDFLFSLQTQLQLYDIIRIV